VADDTPTPDPSTAPSAAEPIGSATPASPEPSAAPGDPAPVGFEVPEQSSNFMVGLAAAVGLGLVAAFIYAALAIFAEREFAILAVLIGIAVAFGFLRFGRTKSILAGVVAAVVAIALYFVAIFVSTAGLFAKSEGESFMSSLSLMVQNASLVVQVYFEDPVSYVFVGISAIIAFVYAAGLAGRKFGRG